ncbi:MAG: hypothetical protein JRJ87_21550 [Deltaproteobacteria bacterium]|nr:hypothetical protein [Deltaproteobacteria bacterium]
MFKIVHTLSTRASHLAIYATAIAVTIGLSCSKASHEQPKVADQAAGKETVDECGRYKVVEKFPSLPCASNDDCAWTAHRPGVCTDPLCESHYCAGPKAWVKAADEMYKRICSGKKWRHCERVKCLHKKPVSVSCVDRACVIAF